MLQSIENASAQHNPLFVWQT